MRWVLSNPCFALVETCKCESERAAEERSRTLSKKSAFFFFFSPSEVK